MNYFNGIFKNKKVLITGHTGFKGSWLSIWLNELGANVIGYALDPYTDKDNFVLANLAKKIIDIRGDIRDFDKLDSIFNKYKPEIIFHLAAQPLVRQSYLKPRETYQTNIMGTVNVLECIRKSRYPQIAVIVTSDKVYDNKEQVWGYKENDQIGGYDPYSSSKGCVELMTSSYRNSFMHPKKYASHGKSITTVRAGNVIGGGDWSENRILPDCIRALEAKETIEIRNPKAIRPWQHVLEALSGYLLLAEKIYTNPVKYCESWNFGPDLNSIINVEELANEVVKKYGRGEITNNCNENKLHESKLLNLDTSKARFRLGWRPALDIEETIEMTVDWYKRYTNEDSYSICINQIKEFIKGN